MALGRPNVASDRREYRAAKNATIVNTIGTNDSHNQPGRANRNSVTNCRASTQKAANPDWNDGKSNTIGLWGKNIHHRGHGEPQREIQN